MACWFALQVRISPKFCASHRWRVAPFPPQRGRRFSPFHAAHLCISTERGYYYRLSI
jgi:hypothetical protein